MFHKLNRQREIRLIAVIAVLCSSVPVMAGATDDDEKIFIWTSKATKPWPAGAKTIAVKPPVFDNSGQTGGIIRSNSEAWYGVVMGELKNLVQRGLPGLKVVEYLDRASITDEQRSAQSGLTDGPAAPVKLRAPDAILIPRFTYGYTDESLNVKRSAGKRAAEKFAQMLPGVGHFVESEKYTTINVRHVTVTCDLKINTLSGVTLYSLSRSLAWKGMTRDGWFDINRTDVRDLPDTHTIIKRLVKEQVQELCSEFMPVRKEIKVNMANLSASLKQAVLAFNAGRFADAGRIARARYEENRHSHHAMFIMGICAEAQCEWTHAEECYRRALSLENLQLQYANALERVQGRDVVGEMTNPVAATSGPRGTFQQDHPGVGEVQRTSDGE